MEDIILKCEGVSMGLSFKNDIVGFTEGKTVNLPDNKLYVYWGGTRDNSHWATVIPKKEAERLTKWLIERLVKISS